jgi:hypothetical protein
MRKEDRMDPAAGEDERRSAQPPSLDEPSLLRAFSENGDPRFSVDTDGEFRRLFAAILDLAPAHVVGSGRNGPG